MRWENTKSSKQKTLSFWCRFDNPFPETYLLLSRNSFKHFVSFFFFLFIYLRESLCCVPCNASWNFEWNGVSFFLSSFFFFSFWFPRSFFYWVVKTRRLVCGSAAWECLRLQQGGRLTKRDADQKWWLRVHSTILLFSFPMSSATRWQPVNNRVVTNYAVRKRINISGQGNLDDYYYYRIRRKKNDFFFS